MKSDLGAKSKSNKKLLAILIVIFVVVAVLVSWQIYRPASNATKSKASLPTLKLTLVGADGQKKTLNSGELADLKSYSASGGYINDEGKISVGNYTGVPILTLLDLVGGVTSEENVTVTGSDGYQVTFTYQQVQGQEQNTYDPNAGAAVQASQPLTVIIAYYCNDTSLASGTGPLTVAIVGPQGLVTPGSYWAYLVTKIEINSA